MRHRLLVVDDEANMRRILQAMLTREGYEVLLASNGRDALELLKAEDISAVVTDLRMPFLDGMGLLNEVKENFSDIPVIIITAHGSIEAAVEALKLGAIDFITKPFDQEQLRLTISKAVRIYESNLTEGLHKGHFKGKWDCIGESPQMQEIHRLVLRTADSPSTVLITGETGTGKELIAKALHENSSRADMPFIKINCAAIPQTLLESEFFGYEKGAFTGAVTSKPGRFELADGGTLFLDEIGEISKEMQVKLLRVLQERLLERVGGLRPIAVDFRLIAASNRNLERAVREGDFRDDLFYRLNVVSIRLPPLRERKEDLPLLTDHFIGVFGERLGRIVTGIHAEALEKLLAYSWPGNIRELENVLERAVLLSENEVLTSGDIDLPEVADIPVPNTGLPEVAEAEPVTTVGEDGALRPLKELVREQTERVERETIALALQRHNGNVTHAARELKISRKSLQLKMKEYDLRAQ
jgi:two-component system, NtrC family, response regulator AtoC